MNFKSWLEARTFAHNDKIVYHWDVESSFPKVLQKQKIGLWVSPNKDMNDSWAGWMVSGNEHPTGKKTFYLHKIAIPRWLYEKHVELEKNTWAPYATREFVITPQNWQHMKPISVSQHARSDLLKRMGASDRRREMHQGYQTGSLKSVSLMDKDAESQAKSNWKMGYGDGPAHWRENVSVLYNQLMAMRPKMAQAAQGVYNNWAQDADGYDDNFGGGGICDAISRAIQDVIVSQGIDVTDGGAPGDDHAWTIAYSDTEACEIDIPCHIYERGGGYNWSKVQGVQFSPNDIQIWQINRGDIDPDYYY